MGAPKKFHKPLNGELAAFRESGEGRVGSLCWGYIPYLCSGVILTEIA
jgi:hypothetical protein